MSRLCNSLLTTLTVILFAMPALGLEPASAEQKRAAQKMFEAADGLYESGQFEQAAQAFRASYALVASPNSRLMIARSLRELQRYEEAYQEYLGTIADAEASAGRYPDTLKAAQAEAEALKPAHDALQLKLQETKPAPPQESPVPEAKPSPPPPVAAQPTQASRPSHSSNSWRTAAYVASAVGATGLVTFGAFGALDRSAYSDLQSKCNAGVCAAGTRDQVDKGRMYQTVANIGLAVTAVGAAAAVTFFIVAPSHSEQTVALQVGPASVSLRAGF